MREDSSQMRDVPWWQNRGVFFTIVFWTMIAWLLIFSVLLGYWVIRGFIQAGGMDFSVLMIVVNDSFVGCAGAGLALACGFGIPYGIVSVLSQRERIVELEQQLV